MLKFSHLTDTGKKRDHNEDFYDYDESLGLFIVCDGMGGHSAGEVASEMACTLVMQEMKKHQSIFDQFDDSNDTVKRKKIISLIGDIIQNVNGKVHAAANADSSKKGMGTTLIMGLITKGGLFVGHVGDSRAYMVREEEVVRLTEDHSLVNDMVRAGLLTKEKAASHPQRNVLTRAIGVQEVVRHEVLFYELMNGDGLYFCSDGLSEYMTDDVLQSFSKNITNKDIARELVRFANHKGGKDNITCICIDYGDKEAPPEHPSNVTPNTKVRTLSKIPLFTSLNFKELCQVLEIAQVRNIQSGEDIVVEGESGEDMFIILKGSVGIYASGILVNELRPGQFFGEMSLIDKSPRSATVKALKEVKVIRITRSDLFPLLKKEARLGLKVFWSFLQNMNKRLRKSDSLVAFLCQEKDESIKSLNDLLDFE